MTTKIANLWHHDSGKYYARGAFRLVTTATTTELSFDLQSWNGVECRIPTLHEYATALYHALKVAYPASQNWSVPFHTIRTEQFGERGLAWVGGTRWVEKNGIVFEEEEKLVLNENDIGACAVKRNFDERYILLVRAFFDDQAPAFDLRWKTTLAIDELEQVQVGCTSFRLFPDRCVYDEGRRLFVDKIVRLSLPDVAPRCCAVYSDKRHKNKQLQEIDENNFNEACALIQEKNLRVEIVETTDEKQIL